MGSVIKIELNDNQRQELEKGYRSGKSCAFRTRSQMIWLKSEGRKSQEIADFQSITSRFIFEQLEHLSFKLPKLTGVAPAAAARIHTWQIIKERIKV